MALYEQTHQDLCAKISVLACRVEKADLKTVVFKTSWNNRGPDKSAQAEKGDRFMSLYSTVSNHLILHTAENGMDVNPKSRYKRVDFGIDLANTRTNLVL